MDVELSDQPLESPSLALEARAGLLAGTVIGVAVSAVLIFVLALVA